MLSALHAARAARAALASPRRLLRVLAADPVDPACAQIFADAGHKLVEKKCSQAELLALIPTFEGLIVRSGVKVSADVIAAGKKLRVVGRAGAGVDNIDLAAATKAGVIVMNTPGGNTSAAAELTLSLIASMARKLPQAVASLKSGVWDRKTFAGGVELRGKTVGVVGLGMIGSDVARRCLALDMKVVGYEPGAGAAELDPRVVRVKTLDELYAASDFITLHTPMNAATKNLICAATLAKCKRGVFIVNAARGGIVHEADLLAALKSGQVAGAALDVYEQEPPTAAVTRELIAHPNVVCTPHLGASTEEAQKKVAREIAEQMVDAFARRGLVGAVNAAHVALAYKPGVEPFVRLAEALGSLQGQMLLADVVAGRLRAAPLSATKVSVELEGPFFASVGAGVAELIKAAVIKGLLPALDDEAAGGSGTLGGATSGGDPTEGEGGGEALNLINAARAAAELGLVNVSVALVPAAEAHGAHANGIRLHLTSGKSGERLAAGALIEGRPCVTQLDYWLGFPTFRPIGHLLTYNNVDRPGEIARVTSVLAEYGLNISTIKVARQGTGAGGPALSVLLVDQRIPGEAVARLGRLDGISNVRTASFA